LDLLDYNFVSISLIISIDSNAFVVQLGVEGFDIDPLMTQESDCEILDSKRPTKELHKKKALKCIVDSFHFTYLISFYNHHFMLYSHDRKYVTQLLPNQVAVL
jgi:hypothetical protein